MTLLHLGESGIASLSFVVGQWGMGVCGFQQPDTSRTPLFTVILTNHA